MNRPIAIFAFTLGAFSLATTSAAAQSFNAPSTPERGFWIDIAHTEFKSFETSLPSTVWYISGRLPVTRRLSAVVDLPFSYAKLDMPEAGKQSSSVFGNPYLGVEFAATEGLMLELGTRAPLNSADEESFADVLAFIADPLRPEAFLDEVIPLSAAATYRYPVSPALSLRARGGVSTLFFTGDETSDTETAFDYGVAGTYTVGIAQVALGVNGRWFATLDEGNFSENSLHHATLSADVGLGMVRPGVTLRLPLDSDYREAVKSSVGFYLQLPVR
jgi:hypothetical protein